VGPVRAPSAAADSRICTVCGCDGYGDRVVSVLGIRVAADLRERWREWFAPPLQPFRADRLRADILRSMAWRRVEPTLEVLDTFHMYGGDWVWLEEAEFVRLPLDIRRALLFRREATGRLAKLAGQQHRRVINSDRTDSRIVWWPSVLRRMGDDRPVLDYVLDGVIPSRHGEVASSVWTAASRKLPGAGDLAGRFPSGSGPNCFSNVMAAAGVSDAEFERIVREPFDAWLNEHTSPIRGTCHDHLPGVVLVWRNSEGQPDHAAVTIGDGYALNKPSQAWCSPRFVWTVPETIAAGRYHGLRLSRYLIR